MFVSQLISSAGVRSSQLTCPRGCSASSSGSNITHDGSTMCNSCGLILKSDEFEAEYQCGGLDKIRPDNKPWMLSYDSKLNGSKCYNYYKQQENNAKSSKSTINEAGSVFNLVNLNFIGGQVKLEKDRIIQPKIECSMSSLSNSTMFRGTFQEEYLVEKTINSWETRQREIGRQVGELCARSQLNNAEKEEISDLAESMLRALDTRNKKCRSLRSLVAACYYECSKRANRPIAINELCQSFQVKQRKLLKYSKKLQKYHHALPLSHSQRVSNEWEQLTVHMFEKLPSFIQFSRNSVISRIQGKEDKRIKQVNELEESDALLTQKEKVQEEGIFKQDVIENKDGRQDSRLLNIFVGQQSSVQQIRQQKQNYGIETTYVPEVHRNSNNNSTAGTNGKCLLFRQQLREVEAQNAAVVLQNIQKQLKQLYECEYLSTMRMGKHPGNFICTLLYVILKSHDIQFQNNTFCKALGVKYSTLSREKKQLHQLLVESLVFTPIQQLPEQIVQELDKIRSHKGSNQINLTQASSDKQRSQILLKKKEDLNSVRSNSDTRLSGGFLAYALQQILLFKDSTILMKEEQYSKGDLESKIIKQKDDIRNIIEDEDYQDDNLLLSCESTSIASNSLGEQTVSQLNSIHFLVSNTFTA